MDITMLEANANKLVSPGRGILAADESLGTIGKRFKPINVENNHQNWMYKHYFCEDSSEN